MEILMGIQRGPTNAQSLQKIMAKLRETGLLAVRLGRRQNPMSEVTLPVKEDKALSAQARTGILRVFAILDKPRSILNPVLQNIFFYHPYKLSLVKQAVVTGLYETLY
ncbi:hypothetical protein TNCV_3190191 [Trichonephila clavipes]|nr:hypothetical protein TNCV_3190191 [Trichonephila clavipes]